MLFFANYRAIHHAGNCVVTWSGGTSYLVTCTDGGHELVVDLNKKSCSCRKWDLSGIPCYHACACIAVRNEPWGNHIHGFYTKELYMKVYFTHYTLRYRLHTLHNLMIIQINDKCSFTIVPWSQLWGQNFGNKHLSQGLCLPM